MCKTRVSLCQMTDIPSISTRNSPRAAASRPRFEGRKRSKALKCSGDDCLRDAKRLGDFRLAYASCKGCTNGCTDAGAQFLTFLTIGRQNTADLK